MFTILTDNKDLNIPAIIELVRGQYPDREDVIIGLQNSIAGHWRNKAYFQFVDSTNANQPGAEWQHNDCIVLNKVDIVIDLLKDGRIGGIEFLYLLD